MNASILLLPGDGIGPEVVASAERVLRAVAGRFSHQFTLTTGIIGGAALTGGRGNIRGTLVGAFVIGFLSDGLVIIGVSAYWQTVFTGAVIVLAVLLNAIQYRRRVKLPSPTGSSPTSPQKDKATTADPALEKTAG